MMAVRAGGGFGNTPETGHTSTQGKNRQFFFYFMARAEMAVFTDHNTLDSISQAQQPANARIGYEIFGDSHQHFKRYIIILLFKKGLKTKTFASFFTSCILLTDLCCNMKTETFFRHANDLNLEDGSDCFVFKTLPLVLQGKRLLPFLPVRNGV